MDLSHLTPLKQHRPTVVFLHMPKTAGTTIHLILTQHFNPDEICPERFDNLSAFSGEQLAAFKLFSLHSSFHNLRPIPKPRKIFSLFREPIERILSQYQHWKSHSLSFLTTHTFAAIEGMHFAKTHDLTTFLKSPDPEILPDIDNVMTRLMSHKVANENGKPWRSDEEMLDAALRNLDELDGIGIFEFLPESIDILCQTFDIAPPTKIERANATRLNPLNDPVNFDQVEALVVNDEIDELLRYRNRLDTILYQAAKDKFLQKTGVRPRRIRSEAHLAGRCVRHYDRTVIHSVANENGCILFGPYINLKKGDYRVQVEIGIPYCVIEPHNEAAVAMVDVCSNFGTKIHAQRAVTLNDLKAGFYSPVEMGFTLKQTTTELEVRVSSLGLTPLSVNVETILETK